MGVVFEIADTEKPALDAAEGLGNGYNESLINLIDENGKTIQSQVYLADERAVNYKLLPCDCYKEFVRTGAEQNNLPPAYIENIRNFASVVDTDAQRSSRQFAILKGNAKK